MNTTSEPVLTWRKALLRWALATGGTLVATGVGGVICLQMQTAGLFPDTEADLVGGFVLASLVVLSGSLLAPCHRFATATVLLLGITLSGTACRFQPGGLLLGGALAAGWVRWWTAPGRSQRSTRWVAFAMAAVALALTGWVGARYLDWPAKPDALPSWVRARLGDEPPPSATFYQYDLGGFIDHEWLWRFDGGAEVTTRLVDALRLVSTNHVPARFWRMPPHYWPRSLPQGAEAFQSPNFPMAGRGPDGEHFVLLHDRAAGRVFVWHKSNF